MRVSLCPSGEKIVNGKYPWQEQSACRAPSEAFVPPAGKQIVIPIKLILVV
jgi:hypothetical protein